MTGTILGVAGYLIMMLVLVPGLTSWRLASLAGWRIRLRDLVPPGSIAQTGRFLGLTDGLTWGVIVGIVFLPMVLVAVVPLFGWTLARRTGRHGLIGVLLLFYPIAFPGFCVLIATARRYTPA